MSQPSRATAVNVVTDSTGATVAVEGDLDLASAPLLMDRAARVLDPGGGELTIDLAGVAFCDSSGITALIKLRQRCDERGWRLRMINLQPPVQRIVVDFGGLGDYLNVG
jgi:anti-sigma B factor antagonist